MDLLILTISGLNDVKKKAEWIDPFYASLSKNANEIKIDHEIILTENNKERAKNNIKLIRDRYNIKRYNINFNSFFLNEDNVCWNHRENLKKGFASLKNSYEINEYDFILTKEFDVIAQPEYTNFFENIKHCTNYLDLCIISNIHSKFGFKSLDEFVFYNSEANFLKI